KISSTAMEYLRNFHWPGNVRELKNVIERALILAGNREILPEHLPAEIRGNRNAVSQPVGTQDLRPLRHVEEEHIERVLLATDNNHSRAATILGISRSTLLAKLKKMAGVRKSDMS
ncbi:MAG TPA: helix-turn-helix domain-containing protein, partial [Geobacteraceae bacterium]